MRFGVIGAGVIGRLRAQSIRTNPTTTLTAVFDPHPGAAERAAAGGGALVAPSLGALLDADLDAVVVSSPVHLHEEACLSALARGCHLLCEKPLSNTVASCRRIVEAAVAADRVLAVGFNLRYYPAVAFVKEVIDSGQIGTLDHLRVFGGHEGLPKFRMDWQYRAPESGGGAMMDVGLHMTDVTRYLLGDITEVHGVMSESVWRVPGCEDNALAVFRSPAGIPAVYQATWTEWRGYQFYVEGYGSRGMVRGAYAPMANMLVTMDRPGGKTTTRRWRYPQIIIREKLRTWHSTALLSFEAELRDFLVMTSGGTEVCLADGHDGLRAVEVAAAVRASGERREVITLPALGRMRTG
jgi:predicted dehydrogenase